MFTNVNSLKYWVFKKCINNLNYCNVTEYNVPNRVHWERALIFECNFSNEGSLQCDGHLTFNSFLVSCLPKRSTSLYSFVVFYVCGIPERCLWVFWKFLNVSLILASRVQRFLFNPYSKLSPQFSDIYKLSVTF